MNQTLRDCAELERSADVKLTIQDVLISMLPDDERAAARARVRAGFFGVHDPE